jgi:molybdopterin-guanine dinucleotide biosynthesis protein A
VDFDAIVLAGGPARRLDGADKGAVQIARIPLLRRALEIVAAARSTVVVGPASNADTAGVVDPARPITFITENPPRGGPAAAISAGLAAAENDLVVVLACDMPFVGVVTVQRLLAAVTARCDGALLVDESGRRQYLAAAYRTTSLRTALDRLDTIQNAPVHKVISVLTMTEIAADPEEAFDIDTWSDVDRSRRLMEER